MDQGPANPWGGPSPQQGGWQQPQPQKQPRHTLMWVVVAATVVVVITCVTIIVLTSTGEAPTEAASTAETSTEAPSEGTSSTEASEPTPSSPASATPAAPRMATPIAADALMGLLLTPAEVAGTFHVPTAIETQSGTDPVGGESSIPLQCRSVWAPAHKETYDPTGSTGVARKTIREDPASGKVVVEAALSYPDAAAASAAVDTVVAAWKQCQSLKFTEQFNGAAVNWQTTIVASPGGRHSMLILSRDAPPDTADCQRVITSDRNVVVDVLACGPGIGNEPFTITRKIAEKVRLTP